MIDRWRMAHRQEMISGAGKVLTGAINYRVIAAASESVGHAKIARTSVPVRHLAHRHGLESRVRGRLDA